MDRAGAFTTVPGDLKWEPDEPGGSISAQLSSPRMVTEAMTMTYDQTEATLARIRTHLNHAVDSDAVAAITGLADTLPAALPDDPETVGHVADGQTALADAQAALQRAVDAAQAALRSHELNNGPAHEAAQSAGGAPERGYVTGSVAGQIELAFNPAEPRGKGGEWIGLDAHDYPGTVGSSKHITRTESGMIPFSAIANLHGAEGEKPGEHRTRQGQDWEDFKAGIAANGIKNPVFVTVDHGQEPKISEGNHRRDAAAELGMTHVPAEVRYFGHAEQQGTVTDRARHTA